MEKLSSHPKAQVTQRWLEELNWPYGLLFEMMEYLFDALMLREVWSTFLF